MRARDLTADPFGRGEPRLKRDRDLLPDEPPRGPSPFVTMSELELAVAEGRSFPKKRKKAAPDLFDLLEKGGQK